METRRMTRRGLLRSTIGAGAALALGAPGLAAAPDFKLERPDVRIGASVGGAGFLPVYVAVDHTWKPAGLTGSLYTFRADTELAQAIAGGSVDVACISLDGLVNLIAANQPFIGFYAGFNTAAFAWVSSPSVKSWRDVKNTAVAVTSYGSMTDEVGRVMMTKHGLTPLTDVQVVQAGPPLSQLQALQSGRAKGAILAPPWNLIAKSEGYNIIATEKDEVASQWPAELWVAGTKFINDFPGTLKTILRAHVAAVRMARTNPQVAIDSLVNTLKIKPEFAKPTYDALMPTFDERGRPPDAKNMAIFWEVEQKAEKVTGPWPNSKFLDDRFIKSFATWAP